LARRVVLGGGVSFKVGRTAGRAMRPEWIYSRGFYFWSKAEGEVRIFGFYNNKKTNKKTNLAYKAFHPIFF